MQVTDDVLEVEIDEAKNGSLFFGPLGRRIRGRFDCHRAAKYDKEAAALFSEWPEPIPGQRLGINAKTGEGYLIEPLHETKHAAIREKIQKRKATLDPHKQTFKAHVPTWLYWLKRAAEDGYVKIVSGTVPETIEGEPKLTFVITRPKGQSAMLADAINRQADAMIAQTEAITKLLAELVKR